MELKLGFGCMRLPMKGNAVDYDEFNKMIDYYMENGFNYFDTAHGYIGGLSEKAIGDCLAPRYERSKYILTNKLTENYFNKEEDIVPFFNNQLEWCGVDYFDYYLMHSQNRENYKKFMNCDAYSEAVRLKEKGLIKHVGLSFHDTSDVLDMILSEHPEIEVVQIQFNYADYMSTSVQSKDCYEVCRKYNKQILVMEPVKGGTLVKLSDDAKAVLDKVNKNKLSYASFAVRFAASFDGMFKVLSGMSSLAQMKDNVSYMENFKKLTKTEMNAVLKAGMILNNLGGIPCTGCRYCVKGCPRSIPIPDLFSCYNAKMTFKDWNSKMYYNIHTKNGGRANECIKCGKCEKSCPQHLEIRKLLEDVSKEFD